jgi:hypothetical protein
MYLNGRVFCIIVHKGCPEYRALRRARVIHAECSRCAAKILYAGSWRKRDADHQHLRSTPACPVGHATRAIP